MTEQEELKQFADECYSEALKHLHSSQCAKALDEALRARDIYAQLQDFRQEASVCNVLSLIYEEMGNSSLELQFQLDALDIALVENAYDLSAKWFNNLGSKLLFTKSYERALNYFQLAIQMSRKATEANLFTENALYNFRLVVSMNLATAYCHLNDMEQAKKYYEIAEEALSHQVSEMFLFPHLVFKANYLKKSGDIEQVNELIPTIVETVMQNPYTSDYLEVLLDTLSLLKEKRDFENWEKVLISMNSHLEENSSIYLKLEAQNQWVIFYHESGKEADYLEACKRYYELSMEKGKQDREKEANSIELSIEMRKTLRQKKIADSIIYLDSLTGIGNRNKMLADSEALIKESYENQISITIGLLDIDFFKESNDTYGHIEGDHCLKAVAKVIEEALGDNGNVYRYGGDEFLILMKTKDLELIDNLGKTIKENLSGLKLRNEKSPICPYVTISQGYTCAKAEQGDTIDSLVKLADRVLYSVKRNGRNNYKFMSLPEIILDM